MTAAAIARSPVPVTTDLTQHIEPVLCRLTLKDEWLIQKNAYKNSESKLSPVYELPRDTAETVFGISLSSYFPTISLQMPATQDSDEGKVAKIRFFDVTEENKERIREVLEFTETLYKAHLISSSYRNNYYDHLERRGNVSRVALLLFVDKERWTAEDKESIEPANKFLEAGDTTELKTKMQEALKKTWDASEKQREAAKKHRMWPGHFSISMENPYKEEY